MLIFRQEPLPAFNSDTMQRLARDLMQRLEAWRESRTDLVATWDKCIDAYLCRRELPLDAAFPFIDRSPFGCDDIFHGVNSLCIRLALAMMPKDESWLTAIGHTQEDPAIINAVRAQQTYIHRKARMRRVWAMHMKQLAVVGTSTLFLSWPKEQVIKRLGTSESRGKIKTFLRLTGQDEGLIRGVDRARETEERFNAPVIRVLDSRDVLLDPEADLQYDRRVASIIQTYQRPFQLKEQLDEKGQPVYKNLQNISPLKAADIMSENQEQTGRLDNLDTLGVNIMQTNQSTDLVPVYIFYLPYYEHEGHEFYDTYVHIAADASGGPRVIRIEENPSDIGARHVITDTYIDFFTGYPYGISAVEKSLGNYGQKNLVEAINLQAMVSAEFPALLMASGILKDDILDRTPGSVTEIAQSAIGQQIVQELPSTQNGADAGMLYSRYFGQKMADAFSTTGGGTSDDPTRSIQSRETATAANIRATSGSLAVDEQAEKFGDSLQEVCQWVYDMSRQVLEPNQQGELEFGMVRGNQLLPASINFDDFNKPRSIEILGLHGVISKGQSIQDKKDALEILGRSAQVLPNAAALASKLVQDLFREMNVETLPEDWMTPQQIAAADPQVQMMALQNALQNPQIQQIVLQQAGLIQPQQNNGGPPNAPQKPTQANPG